MNAGSNRSGFLDAVQHLSGLISRAEAARAAGAALGALSAELVEDERRLLAADLGENWKRAVMQGGRYADSRRGGQTGSADELYRRTAAGEDVDPGFGREHAQAVCAALARVLGDDTLDRLRRALPDELAGLLVAPEPTKPREAPETRPPDSRERARRGAGRTLAGGRPGSSRPLSESRPMQAGSIMESDNPRGDTKVSSAPGVPADRGDRTLSTGGPGSERPVSESGDE